ncbi:MAG TPA: type II secretion system protein N [Usitatibacter sp.]|nr:type II secretion system protein N [Usitatibacter sp.]
MATAPEPAKDGAAASVLVAALALVLAWQLSYWTWQFAAPRSSSAAAAGPAADVDLGAIARLFGADAPASGGSSVDGLVLKGVVAPTPGTAASAIFAPRAGRDVSIFIGSDVRPGVKLVEVDPDHVIVSRGGTRERIDLAPERSVAPAHPRVAARGVHVDVARTGTHQYSLSRAQLDEALRDPSQLQYLGQIAMPPGGGVRMEAAPPGSLAAKLGLQAGDVIRKVNGQPVASTGDLARLYQQFATLQQVQAEVLRGNATLELAYQIH